MSPETCPDAVGGVAACGGEATTWVAMAELAAPEFAAAGTASNDGTAGCVVVGSADSPERAVGPGGEGMLLVEPRPLAGSGAVVVVERRRIETMANEAMPLTTRRTAATRSGEIRRGGAWNASADGRSAP